MLSSQWHLYAQKSRKGELATRLLAFCWCYRCSCVTVLVVSNSLLRVDTWEWGLLSRRLPAVNLEHFCTGTLQNLKPVCLQLRFLWAHCGAGDSPLYASKSFYLVNQKYHLSNSWTKTSMYKCNYSNSNLKMRRDELIPSYREKTLFSIQESFSTAIMLQKQCYFNQIRSCSIIL